MLTLSLYETRIIGALLEKETTTPDQYPLSLNALMLACNQKSNRDPVLELDEACIQDTLDALIKKGLVGEVLFGSRVKKFRQRFGNTEFSEFSFSKKELSILCVLFLRGPQTPGELRTRTSRLCEFTNTQEVESVLQEMIDAPSAFITKLSREPGKREARYAHLFSGDEFTAHQNVSGSQTDDSPTINSQEPHTQKNISQDERIIELEKKVESMSLEIDELKKLWNDLIS